MYKLMCVWLGIALFAGACGVQAAPAAKQHKKDEELTGPELVKRVRVLLLLLRNQERKAKPLTARIAPLEARNDSGAAGKANEKRIASLKRRREPFIKKVKAYKARIDKLVPTLDKEAADTKSLLANCRLRNIQNPAYDPVVGSDAHTPPCPKATASPAPSPAPSASPPANQTGGALAPEDDDDPGGLFEGELPEEPGDPADTGEEPEAGADPTATEPEEAK